MKPQARTSNMQHPTSNIQVAVELHDGPNVQRQYALEERLLEFASAVIDLTENLIRIFYSSIQTAKRNALSARQLRSAS
jgi:predicted nucleotidyltransferase